MNLSYNKVFNQYNVRITDRLSQITDAMYMKIRLFSSRIIPLSEYEIYRFGEDRLNNDDISDQIPLGFDFYKNEQVEGYLNLGYIDLYDYLPKEDLSNFKRELGKCVSRNKLDSFSIYRTREQLEKIDNMEKYSDKIAFFKLHTIKFCHNDYLKKYSPKVTISLHNLSSSFVVVQYRLHISKEFNNVIKQICTTKYTGYTDVSRQFNIPWYKPKKFGRKIYDGNQIRCREFYQVISRLKWQAMSEIKKYFTINFLSNEIFPPTFETYSTNIRPSKKYTNRGFWKSVMFDFFADYAPEFNSCVCWGKFGNHEGVRLSAYCGGNYSTKDCSPKDMNYEIANIYAVFIVANTMELIAERDIATCNRKISKAIKSLKTVSVLKVRVNVEKKLYYSYRFINEFTGNTINHDYENKFYNEFYKRSISSIKFQTIHKNIKNTKEKYDNIFKILDDMAEYRSAELNIKLQWLMMIVTVLSLLITLITVNEYSLNPIKTIFITVINWIKNTVL